MIPKKAAAKDAPMGTVDVVLVDDDDDDEDDDDDDADVAFGMDSTAGDDAVDFHRRALTLALTLRLRLPLPFVRSDCLATTDVVVAVVAVVALDDLLDWSTNRWIEDDEYFMIEFI